MAGTIKGATAPFSFSRVDEMIPIVASRGRRTGSANGVGGRGRRHLLKQWAVLLSTRIAGNDGFRSHGFAKEKALPFMTASIQQVQSLLIGFNTFCDDYKTQVFA